MGKTFSTGLLTDGIWQDSSNNIGIGGAVNASYKLTVTGTTLTTGAATFSSSVTIAGTNDGVGTLYVSALASTNAARLRNNDASYGTLDILNSNASGIGIYAVAGKHYFSGNVGIGTSSPLQTNTNRTVTTINGTNDAILNLATGGTLRGYIYVDSSSYTELYSVGQLALLSNASQPMTFATNGSERMRITSGGNVLIGSTTDPGQKLYVAGDIRGGRLFTYSGGNASDPIIAPADDTNNGIFFPAADTFAITTGGSERMRIRNNGSIMLNGNDFGTVYNFSFKGFTGLDCFAALSVRSNGDNIINFFNQASGYVASISVAASSVTYGTGSDYRLKEDLKDFNGLEKVSAIKVYDFKFKAEGDRMEGVLAHELQEIIPYAVTGYKDELDANGNAKIQNVDYSKIVPVLVKAIQELSAKVTALENR